MNRADHIHELLKDGQEHCTHDIWRQMGTAPMRAKHELEKQGTKVETVRMCRHNGANYAVYRLISSPVFPTIQERVPTPKRLAPLSASPLESRKEQAQPAMFELKNPL